MNSGLPSLLDAIFGKQDLSLVSLEEIYEVIREFPSFNAGHFLLAKKLKLQNDPAYEKETMRTALYFNNPFWLQSLLDDGHQVRQVESFTQITETKDEDEFVFEEHPEEALAALGEESNYIFESYTPIEQPATVEDELDAETEEILDEKLESDPVRSEDIFQHTEPGTQTVTSFDELIAKYQIQPLEMADETPVSPEIIQPASEEIHTTPEKMPEVIVPESSSSSEKIPERNIDQFETVEEVVNEYGIFEEIVVRKTDHDHDLDAFDRPLDQIPFVSEKIPEEVIPAEHSGHVEDKISSEQLTTNENTGNEQEENATEPNENSSILEFRESADSPDKTDEHDYDAFDKPQEEPVELESMANENDHSAELSEYDPDNTGEPVDYSDDSESGANGQMQEMSDRLREQQKVLSAFSAKNADSIVFTPYHMVDYFASQGIKLVLEDNPPDQFGKQLKSFTDWLKVMKKLPVQPASVKEEEKEAAQIRHFAAHSIEERDVLTEAMAEVLAKQGMYDNAIALYQKLSLIYPPKSAYFASRIEQLKASLP